MATKSVPKHMLKYLQSWYTNETRSVNYRRYGASEASLAARGALWDRAVAAGYLTKLDERPDRLGPRYRRTDLEVEIPPNHREFRHWSEEAVRLKLAAMYAIVAQELGQLGIQTERHVDDRAMSTVGPTVPGLYGALRPPRLYLNSYRRRRSLDLYINNIALHSWTSTSPRILKNIVALMAKAHREYEVAVREQISVFEHLLRQMRTI
jgi:hypothetical protein